MYDYGNECELRQPMSMVHGNCSQFYAFFAFMALWGAKESEVSDRPLGDRIVGILHFREKSRESQASLVISGKSCLMYLLSSQASREEPITNNQSLITNT